MKKLVLFFLATLCFLVTKNTVTAKANAEINNPADKNATKETKALYANLKKQLNQGIMFGHQDALAYGVDWKYEAGRSDIKDVTGDYPAVYGWELGHLEIDKKENLDNVPFDKMQQFIRQGYERGGVITISWHLNNPLTGKSAWDPEEGTVASILPGGEKHDLFKNWLDKVAVFFNGLKGKDGEFIPVIFRPFHELNGNWFWWGGKHCSDDEFKKLWKFTVKYLRDQKNIHHLLYAYNTDRFSTRKEYLAKYPGDEWVDVIGFDIYQRNTPKEKFIQELQSMFSILGSIATEHHKIPALTEFGGNLSDSSWWTGTFLNALGEHRISFILGWRNAGMKPGGQFEYYVPYKGHSTAVDFLKFYNSGKILFEKQVASNKLYQ